jgi:hypothetical protein
MGENLNKKVFYFLGWCILLGRNCYDAVLKWPKYVGYW